MNSHQVSSRNIFLTFLLLRTRIFTQIPLKMMETNTTGKFTPSNENVFLLYSLNLFGHQKSEVRVESFINSEHRTPVGRRLADGGLSSSGEIATDREDSPLQSKRSSMFEFLHNLMSVSCCCC
jgi:hypothetical protein